MSVIACCGSRLLGHHAEALGERGPTNGWDTTMFNAQELLGQLMGAGMARSTSNRIGHAMGPQGLGASGSPLGSILGSLGGGTSAGGLGGLASRAGDLFGQASTSVRSGDPLALGGLAAIAGALLGGGGGALKGAVGGGALALLGSLAYQALRPNAPVDEQQMLNEAPLGLREARTPQEEAQVQQIALLAIRAMVSAAKADGVIDPHEYQRILGQLKEAGADDAARAFVEDEMRKPLDVDSLVQSVTRPEEAVEIYAASLLAIDVDTEKERQYLQILASRLGLGPDVVQRIHQTLGVAV
jgi:uncharacterized membrane protein YebE (DUF533 family)